MYDVILLVPAAVAADGKKRQPTAGDDRYVAHLAIPTDDARIS